MSKCLSFAVVALISWVVCSGPATASERQRTGFNSGTAISDDGLARMGLAGMQPVSDAEGDQLRGQGFRAIQLNLTIVIVIGNGNTVNVNQFNVLRATGVRPGRGHGFAHGRR